MDPVPVTGFAENFSPMPRMAPPPLGSEIDGGVEAEALEVPEFPAAFPLFCPSVAAVLGAADAEPASGPMACCEVFILSRSVGNGVYLT